MSRASVFRQQMLQATREVVLAEGLDVTMDRIAEHAGITRITLYRHFGNRAGLLSALLLLESMELAEKVEAVLDDSRRRFPERVIDVIMLIVPEAHKSVFFRAFLDQVPFGEISGPEIDERFGNQLRQFFGPYFEAPEARRLLRNDPAETLDWLIRVTLMYLIVTVGAREETADVGWIRPEIERFVMPAILTPNALSSFRRRLADHR